MDYSKIAGDYISLPESIREVIEKDTELTERMRSSPCAYFTSEGSKAFNLIDSEENDILECGVSKEVTNFAGTDRVLFSYKKEDSMSFVVSGNEVDGYCVFHIV